MNSTQYITKPGDRWDLISNKAYGTIGRIGDLIRANPSIAPSSILAPGIVLEVPIIAASNVETDKSLLPPWKT